MLRRLVRRLFRRRYKRRLTGVVQYQSLDKQIAWVCPHEWRPIFTVGAKVLRRSGFLREPLRAGDRVEWDDLDGALPRRLRRYRRAPRGR